MMLEEEQLMEIAYKVTLWCSPDIRDDVFQEAWVRFLRERPRTRKGAWIMASGARGNFWKKNRRRDLPQLPLSVSDAGSDLHVMVMDMKERRKRRPGSSRRESMLRAFGCRLRERAAPTSLVTADYRSDGHPTEDPALRRGGRRQPTRQR